MKHTFNFYLAKTLAVGSALAVLLLAMPVAFSQQAANLGLERAGGVVLSERGQVLEMSDGKVIDGDVIVSGPDCHVIIHPGVQTIKNSVQVNGSNARMLFGFNEDKENSHLKVEGTLKLGPENRPLLNLDLSKTHLVKGEAFTIASAGNIVGEFAGMSHGDTMHLGDYSLKINYDANSITLLVTKAPKRPHPRITPIVQMDHDLIDPTSTAPHSW